MTAALVTENLALLASAPSGVQKLRFLVIELAIQGRLVPQDGNAESAGVLLSAISQARAKFYEASSSRPAKVQTEVGDDEQPFVLPNGWRWARLGWLAHPQAGFAFKSGGFNQDGRGLPLIRIRDVGQSFSGTFFDGDYRAEFVVDYGDYLISMDGEFRIAKWCAGRALLNQRVSRLQFFSLALRSEFVALALQARLRELQGAKAYTTVDHLSGGQIADCVIGIPPLEEQHRIVAKVDELMALCDRLEAEQADAEAAHAKLVEALLASLTQARDAADFRASWQQLAEHFHTLFTTEASIEALKRAIVHLAVMGKLVAPIDGDASASDLLAEIDIARAVCESAPGWRKRQRSDQAEPMAPPPFPAPTGWGWRKLGSLLLITGGVTLGRKLGGRALVSVPYLRVANVQRGFLVLDQLKQVEVPVNEVEKYALAPGDLLTTEGGDWDKVGRTAIWKGEIANCLHQNHVFRLRPYTKNFSSRWVELYLNSPPARDYFAGSSKQTTNLASINMAQLRACAFPVPPLAEQQQIVALVDSLLERCDRLKVSVALALQQQDHLASVLAEQARA